jgi:tRNA1(Val) A37 N6-methylase TrmN6
MVLGETILVGFDWESLPAGSKVVDIGAGFGAVSAELAKGTANGPNPLHIILQDRQEVIDAATKAWNIQHKRFVDSGSVSFQGEFTRYFRSKVDEAFSSARLL